MVSSDSQIRIDAIWPTVLTIPKGDFGWLLAASILVARVSDLGLVSPVDVPWEVA
jgi:hypothetical protein